MSTYTIGETARRSGFNASTLRFYEDIGLVGPSGRTDSGYRLYDADALTRLAFVGRAKQLGCTLAEITDLVAIWDGQRCGPVQRRFHDLITAKIDAAEVQAVELSAFAAQLRAAAAQLGVEPTDGPCGPACACVADGPEAALVTIGRPSADCNEPSIACTLDADAVPGRLADWDGVLAAATHRVATGTGVRIEFGTDVDLAALGDLIGAERRCCPFLHFTLVVDAATTVLEVRAPASAAAMVTDLFGAVA